MSDSLSIGVEGDSLVLHKEDLNCGMESDRCFGVALARQGGRGVLLLEILVRWFPWDMR